METYRAIVEATSHWIFIAWFEEQHHMAAPSYFQQVRHVQQVWDAPQMRNVFFAQYNIANELTRWDLSAVRNIIRSTKAASLAAS
jgi:hypothetical protein